MMTSTSLLSNFKQLLQLFFNRCLQFIAQCPYCDQVSKGFELSYLPIETVNELVVYCGDKKEINNDKK